MRRIRIGLAAVLSVLAVAPASAMTFMKMDYVCPIGGERFSAETMGSGTAFGHYLDGRLHGAIQSPWPLVQCPGNGFVMYDDVLSDAERDMLTPFINSDEYQRMRASETSYWLLSRILEVIDAPAKERAAVLRSATWQASAEQYPRYVAAASAAYQQQCPDDRAAGQRDRQWLYCQMMLGEWERRLSRFAPARARFERLQPQVEVLVRGDDLAATREQFAAEIVQQLQLIAEGNSANMMAVDANAPPLSDAPLSAEDAANAAAAAADAAADAAVEAGRLDDEDVDREN